MTERLSLKELHDIVDQAIPEPGTNTAHVDALLRETLECSEGVWEFLRQGTIQITQELLTPRNTYHPQINDYDFLKRLLGVIEGRRTVISLPRHAAHP